jgi:hypothetical protein
MSEVDSIEIAQFLTRIPLFQGLDRDQLRLVAEKFTKLSVYKDDIVFNRDEEAEAFYLVYAGRFLLLEDEQEEQDHLSSLAPGDHFGDEALLSGRTQPYTVQAFENSQLLRMDVENFESVLESIPLLEERLVVTAGSRKRITKKKSAKWLQSEETTMLIRRKHWVYLLAALFWPALLIGLSLAVLAFVYEQGLQIGLFISSGAATFGLIWMIWRLLDWTNDYFIITNRRVVSLQKVIGIYDNRTETPISSVIANDVTRSFLGQILNYGDISVRSYMGRILLEGVPKPYEMVNLIERNKTSAQVQNRYKELNEIDQAVLKVIQGAKKAPGWDSVQPVPMPKSPDQAQAAKTEFSMGNALRNLFKMRFENQEIITYRRHWYALVGKIWWQVLLIILVVFLSSWLAVSDFPILAGCSIGTLINLVLFLTMGYRIWDWSNDIFQLTTTQIIDIDKKPLGAEGKKTAPLDAPDFRIEHVRPSLLANLLNFGNVIVYIGQTQFNIEGVFNPDQVHSEVASRRQMLLAKKETDRIDGERGRMMDWLKAFYLQMQKGEEDGLDSSGNRPT